MSEENKGIAKPKTLEIETPKVEATEVTLKHKDLAVNKVISKAESDNYVYSLVRKPQIVGLKDVSKPYVICSDPRSFGRFYKSHEALGMQIVAYLGSGSLKMADLKKKFPIIDYQARAEAAAGISK